MQTIPTKTVENNILKFAREWSQGNLGSGPKVKAKAQKYLDLYGDWIYQINPNAHSMIAGCIEWHNFHEI